MDFAGINKMDDDSLKLTVDDIDIRGLNASLKSSNEWIKVQRDFIEYLKLTIKEQTVEIEKLKEELDQLTIEMAGQVSPGGE